MLPKSFWHWVAWRLRNKQGPRPDDVPAKVPDSWWKRLKKWVSRRKPKPTPPPLPPPPPPPAPPRSRWTNPPWQGKVMYVCWGFSTGDFTPDQLAARMSAHGMYAGALELTPENRPFQAVFRDALHLRGMKYLIWERSDEVSFETTANEVREFQPDGYLADIEGPMSDLKWVESFDKTFDSLPRALCATGALDQSFPGGAVEAASHWKDNWDCTMQDYVVHGTDPDHGENFAFWRQFPINAAGFHHWPVLEVRAEGSPSLSNQLPLVAPWNGSYGVYTAEYLTDEDWTALG